jgi:hypothetical protein
MDYISQLAKEHSKSNSNKIARSIGNNPDEFKKIIEIIYTAEAPLPQRAAWLLAIINKQHPELLKPYLENFAKDVSNFKIDAIKRNMLLVLASHTIPKKLQGKLIDICFNFMLSPKEAIAVKVHSMQIIANIAAGYPDLQQELKSAIENEIPKNSQAFSARARHVLKAMK